MSSFFSDPDRGGNGQTYTDDNNASTGLGNGGFWTRLIPMLSSIIGIANYCLTQAQAAAQSVLDAAGWATTALNAPGTQATSATSVAIPTALPATLNFTIQTGKSISPSMTLKAASSANPKNWVIGDVLTYDSGTGALSISAVSVQGTGTYADWVISLAASPLTTVNNAVVPKSGPYTMLKTDAGQIIEASGTMTLSYEPCATLGNAWYHYVRTANGALITLDPNGSETVNGVTTLRLPPNALVLISTNGTSLTAEIVEQKPLATYTVSSPVAAINFLTIFESGAGFYDTFRIRVRNVSPSAADQLRMRVALDGVLNSGANWNYTNMYVLGSTPGGTGSTGANTYPVTIANMLETTHMAAEIEVFSPSSTNYKHVLSRAIYRAAAYDQVAETNSALWTGGAALTGFGLYWTSGANFDAGTIEIEGVRK